MAAVSSEIEESNISSRVWINKFCLTVVNQNDYVYNFCMSVCSVISYHSFISNPRYRQIVDDMHRMMHIVDHPYGRHCRMGHGRLRRAEIEAGKHLEYPWAVISGDFSDQMKVLDAGCGRGILQYYLARMGCQMSACDIDGFRSKKFLKIHRFLHELRLTCMPDLSSRLKKNARYFGVDVDYHIESIQNISWEDNFFDRVYSISVLEHVQPLSEQRVALRQLARVLKPGGLMLLTLDYSARPIPGKSDVFLPEDIRRVIEWSGLVPIEPPVFDVDGWDDYLVGLADFYGVPRCLYSAFTLVLKK